MLVDGFPILQTPDLYHTAINKNSKFDVSRETRPFGAASYVLIERLFKCMESSDIAAGVIPGIRAA
jgi:hypothetical protein